MTGEEPNPPTTDIGRPVVLIVLCSACYLLDALANAILGPLGPSVAAAVHLSRPMLGAIFSANLAGQSIGFIVIPMLQGAFGARRIIIACTAAFGVFEIATGWASTAQQLLVLRFLTGLALAGPLPLCLALTAASVSARRRGLALMTLFVGYSIGNVAAGALPAAFPGPDGWRACMWTAGGACLLATAANLRWLPAAPSHGPGRPQRLAAAEDAAWRLFSRPLILGTALIWALFVCAFLISYCVNTWLPSMLVSAGRSPAISAASVSAFAAGGLLAALIVGLLIDWLGSSIVLTAFFLGAAACLLVVGLELHHLSDLALLSWLSLGGFFMLGGYAGINVVLAEYYPAPLRAAGAGWAKSVGRLGTLLAPWMIGVALSRGAGDGLVMTLFTAPAALAALAIVWIGLLGRARRKPVPVVAQAA